MVRRKAFTMVELVFVIVIFGIIASIGAELISKLYMNYLRARTINYLQAQSEITLEQIAKRLQYRIKDTAIARKSADIKILSHPNVDSDYNIVEWISYSNEALIAGKTPGWSGFIDLESSNTSSAAKTLSTPGSNLGLAAGIVDNLTNAKVDLTSTNPAALIFKRKPVGYYDPKNDNGYGWKTPGTVDKNFITKVYRNSDDVFSITGDTPDSIFEQYYLADTAYAIVSEGTDKKDFNLTLKYNYQPWLSSKNTYLTGSSSLLATNVNLFRIKQVGSTIRLKLCLHDGNLTGTGDYLVACKEEVVF